MDLPNAVEAYFRADAGTDPERVAQTFAADGVVEDEGERHQGRLAIRAWWLGAKTKYGHVAEPVTAERQGNRILVRARVSGTFPTSPAVLGFAFTIDGNAIAHLRVG